MAFIIEDTLDIFIQKNIRHAFGPLAAAIDHQPVVRHCKGGIIIQKSQKGNHSVCIIRTADEVIHIVLSTELKL